MHPTQTLRAIRQVLCDQLAAAGIDEAGQEATWMIETASGLDRLRQLAYADEPLSEAVVTQLTAWLAERLTRKPLAQILGWTVFYGLRFTVTPDVLCPRPETELLVECISDRIPATGQPQRVVDLGTGSGAIAIALAHSRPDCALVAIDRSVEALAVARKNGVALGVAIDWRQGDWCGALRPDEAGTFAAIVSNPPYIPEVVWQGLAPEVKDHEPTGALVGGQDGLDPYRIIPAQAWTYLIAGGWLAVEHGQGQGVAIKTLFEAAGYVAVEQQLDYAGIDRIVVGCKPAAA
ncbi:MAG: peptide chain release factor N(5)-glutamine methyltransferase [Candidatus Sericytochromatia bacterium]|nr:peptide chain release factor N(5)-glutamine methyltransferase [Candidatus Sericytochromatia bacterium]